LTPRPHNRDHRTTGGNYKQPAKRSQGHARIHIPPKSSDLPRMLKKSPSEIHQTHLRSQLGTTRASRGCPCYYETNKTTQFTAMATVSLGPRGPPFRRDIRATVTPGRAGHRHAGPCGPPSRRAMRSIPNLNCLSKGVAMRSIPNFNCFTKGVVRYSP